MSEVGWEARMAARAQARSEGGDNWRDPNWERHVADLYRQGREAVQDMTLGQAVDRLRGLEYRQVVCACIGPPFCCRFGYEQADALQRAAHIAIKLVADALGTTRVVATTSLKDKREGACARGPCRSPRRCWNYDHCWLYAVTGGEAK